MIFALPFVRQIHQKFVEVARVLEEKKIPKLPIFLRGKFCKLSRDVVAIQGQNC